MMESYHQLLPESSERKIALERRPFRPYGAWIRSLWSYAEKNDLMGPAAALQESMDKVPLFTGLNYDVRRIPGLPVHQVPLRPHLQRVLREASCLRYDTIDTILFKCKEDADYI